ncbi:MAG TPA: S41 family peptidase [Xanthomonadales bacterium]|nr:S41 family peptidase [Xanthomonadales bacterium]
MRHRHPFHRRAACVALFALAGAAGPALAGGYDAAVETLATKLETRFVDPATGERYAQMLRANLAAGRYAAGADARAVAQSLTDDLQAVAPDGHLRVDLAPEPGMVRGPLPGEAKKGAPAPGARVSSLASVDLPSVAETKWVADGVAYIRFNQFMGEPASIAAIDAFVKDYAGAKAVVIDTRTLARGGGLAEMDALFPHLFARETALVEMAVAKDGDGGAGPFRGTATLREVPGPAGQLVLRHYAVPAAGEQPLAGAKVFFLTSRRTRSAGEHFALALKRTHRATLIGERTAGANHFGGIEPIGAGLAAFIPVGRTYDPDTGADWEGTGVVPDIEVPVDAALERALALARH